MAKPNQPKDVKPKTDEGASKSPIDGNMKMVVINLATTVLICVLFISVNYVLQSSLLTSKLSQTVANTDSTDTASSDEQSSDEVQKGIILDLGDFILNLSDASPRKYLKANVALEVSKTDSDPDTSAAATSENSKEGAKEGGAAASDPIATQMEQYKPAIRDAIITTFSNKTSSELATVAGKELAKEQITEAVNGIFSGERQVIRVSFGQFIIQ